MSATKVIRFFYEELDVFKISNPLITKKWLLLIANGENQKIEGINYVFCNDEYLYKINLEYLNHDTYTDIVTFDNSEEEDRIEGDIFISVDRVKENAITNNTAFKEELKRVMAHGLLHLFGYNDKTADEQKVMRKKEEACLSLYKN